jgi:hypothetical protein
LAISRTNFDRPRASRLALALHNPIEQGVLTSALTLRYCARRRPRAGCHSPACGDAVVHLFIGGCAAGAIALVITGRYVALPVWLLAAEVFATILGLFVFGSFRWQIHKNALTYGMLLVVIATFSQVATSTWHVEIAQHGWIAWTQDHLLTFRGLDGLIHADTMLFILGLTWLVSVIAQTRLLEGITFFVLRRNNGAILPTVVAVTAVVAVASGILSGVPQ